MDPITWARGGGQTGEIHRRMARGEDASVSLNVPEVGAIVETRSYGMVEILKASSSRGVTIKANEEKRRLTLTQFYEEYIPEESDDDSEESTDDGTGGEE